MHMITEEGMAVWPLHLLRLHVAGPDLLVLWDLAAFGSTL